MRSPDGLALGAGLGGVGMSGGSMLAGADDAAMKLAR
jgi:hypothetical protein